MTTSTRRIQTLITSLETGPGSLARVYRGFREAEVNVISSWAYEMGPGEAQGIFYPSDLNRARDALASLGLDPRLGEAVYVEGDDRVGVYADVLDRVAKAGVSLHASDAFAVGDRFATVLFTDEASFPALCRALGCASEVQKP